VLIRPPWAPEDVDMEQPSAARMYDYYLGGHHNFEADRKLAREIMRVWPDLPHIARANRAFLHRAVAYLGSVGIHQFLDLGSGIPTVGNVHEVAERADHRARTVYVDSDAVAVAHAEHMLTAVPNALVVQADLRHATAILEDPAVRSFLDFDRPVAILMVAVLHFLPDTEDPAGVIATFRETTVPGSHIVMSHATNEYWPERVKLSESLYNRAANPLVFRSRDAVAALLEGYDLVAPGLVDMTAWRPDPRAAQTDPLGGDVTRYSGLAAVGKR
jgi:hypothetical protein